MLDVEDTNSVIASLCQAGIWLVPLVLLVARFYKPKLISWWFVVIATASLSWMFDAKIEELRIGKPFDSVRQCRAANPHEHPPPDCPTPLVDYFAAHPSLRWMPGIICLILFLPCYGIFRYAFDNMPKDDGDNASKRD